MSTLQDFLKDRIDKAGYNLEKNFSLQSVIFTKDQKDYLHTFNYLKQEIAEESYLSLNEFCLRFNEIFSNESESILTQKQKEWLADNWFERVIEHLFSNEQLEMDFYPAIKGHYIKDKENRYYMLVSFQKYDSNDYTGYKLIQFTQPSFSFPHQDNYMN